MAAAGDPWSIQELPYLETALMKVKAAIRNDDHDSIIKLVEDYTKDRVTRSEVASRAVWAAL